MVLYLASDLLWATRIKSCADDLGIAARPVRTLEMLRARLADCGEEVRGLLLDLSAGEEGREGEIAFSMIEALKDWSTGQVVGRAPVRVTVFGPHVQAELLAQARAAGASDVMTRGSLDARLPESLLRLDGRSWA